MFNIDMQADNADKVGSSRHQLCHRLAMDVTKNAAHQGEAAGGIRLCDW